MIALLVIAILPVFIIGMFIYKKDKIKEPTNILVKLFIGGISSCFITILLTLVLEAFFPFFAQEEKNLNLIELIIKVFIGVALIEEFSKWFMAHKISYKSEYFDEFYDGILFCAFVSLGFACFENILYVFEYGAYSGILRAFLAVPGHACDGVLMGYYLGLAKLNSINGRKNFEKKYLILSLIVPTLTHGIYDYCLFTEKTIFFILFIVFVICMYIYVYEKIKKASKIERKMIYKNIYCPSCGRKVDSIYCPNCGRKNE